MANPFYVEPPNPFQALMTGTQAYDRARQSQAYQEVGQQLANGGVDKAMLGRLVGMGPSAAPLLQAVGTLGKSEQTDTLKNLAAENASRASRGLPALSPLQYQTAISTAGANKSTINMPPMEREYDKKMGGELAELNVGIIKGAANARSNQANLDRLEQLLNDPGVYQGTAGEKVLQLKKAAQAVGINVGDGVGGAEAAQAISNQLALQARNPAGGAGMPGAMSDADRDYLKTMQPGLEKTPDGNRQIIDVNRKLNQRAIEVEARRQSYIKKNGRLNEGFYADLNGWSNANPLFAGAQQRAPAAPAQSAPMQGARQAPDGNFYVPDPARPGKYLRVMQ